MIPPLPALLRACAFLARCHEWEFSPRDVRLLASIAERHQEAAQLATVPREEPAALFFALCRDLYLFGADYVVLPIVVSTNHAQALGLDLRAHSAQSSERSISTAAKGSTLTRAAPSKVWGSPHRRPRSSV